MPNKNVLVRLSPETIKVLRELSKKTTGKESVSQAIEILVRKTKEQK